MFFRCVDSVSELYLHPWDMSLMLHVFDYVILCFKLCERPYTRCDGYENYMHGVMRMEKG